jgi:hypothetical protein
MRHTAPSQAPDFVDGDYVLIGSIDHLDPDFPSPAGGVYVANGWYGPGWFGPGWYWDLWFGAFTFLPADGFLYNPFGWGFYSPLVVYRVSIVRPAGNVAHHFDFTEVPQAHFMVVYQHVPHVRRGC